MIEPAIITFGIGLLVGFVFRDFWGLFICTLRANLEVAGNALVGPDGPPMVLTPEMERAIAEQYRAGFESALPGGGNAAGCP